MQNAIFFFHNEDNISCSCQNYDCTNCGKGFMPQTVCAIRSSTAEWNYFDPKAGRKPLNHDETREKLKQKRKRLWPNQPLQTIQWNEMLHL